MESRDALDILSVPSEERQVPVDLYAVEEEPIRIWVENGGEASYLKHGDIALWTLQERLKWEDKYPFRAWLFRWGLGPGPKGLWSSTYPGDL